MKINLDRFPYGKTKALTMSYDDGVVQDKRLAGIFNRYGIQGTFHLNGGLFGDNTKRERIAKDEILQTYKGHEISAHGFTHQPLSVTPNERIADEILRDRQALESLTGAPVRGMSYPYGSMNDTVANILPALGIEYCRKIETTGSFNLPEDFMRWEATCHHNDNLLELTGQFLQLTHKWQPSLMCVWGHSYEFDGDDNWDLIEQFCKMAANNESIWYATCIEIVDYIKALRSLKFSVDQKTVLNQSAQDVWISVDDAAVKISGGGITKL